MKDIWREGGTVFNCWLTLPCAYAAEILAHQGWDALTVDMQHGLADFSTAVASFTAISTSDTVPMVRVPRLDEGVIQRVLDAGAYGLICPMINNVADARRLVAATNYAPKGERSYGPNRAWLYGGSDYPEHANDTVTTFAMIETREALESIDEILSVDGLDAIYVGPSDLSLSMGCAPKVDDLDAPAAKAVDHILARAKAHGVIAGIPNLTVKSAHERKAKGFQLITIGGDARMLGSGSRDLLGQMRPLA